VQKTSPKAPPVSIVLLFCGKKVAKGLEKGFLEIFEEK